MKERIIKEINQFRMRKEWEKYLWEEFLKEFEKANPKESAKFLNNLLSDDEKFSITRRWAVIVFLKEGLSYKEIGRILWISPNTISAIKKSIEKRSNYRSSRYYTNKSLEEKRKRMKGLPPQTIFDYWLNFPWPSKSGKGRWKFLNYQG